MNSVPASCPDWLRRKIMKMGGTISFYEFMDTVLNDTKNGYYGSGKAQIGIKGDFVTSASLSDDFSLFIAKQVEDWLTQLLNQVNIPHKLNIIEFGAGEGLLVKGIIKYFLNKRIMEKISFKIIELNDGMRRKQFENLKYYLNMGIDISWINLNELENQSINGVVIANEVLDAFPVERIQVSDGNIYRQGISIDENKGNLVFKKINLTDEIVNGINYLQNELGINIPPENAPNEWITELHLNNSMWLENVYKKFNNGIFLIIDYAIDARRYYSNINSDGTLIAYKNQKASSDFLQSPGDCDLTCHLCNEILVNSAKRIGFEYEGFVKQGEALLSLGLAKELFEIQKDSNLDLSKALLKREALLRLVDPICLGDFKWFVFKKTKKEFKINTICLD